MDRPRSRRRAWWARRPGIVLGLGVALLLLGPARPWSLDALASAASLAAGWLEPSRAEAMAQPAETTTTTTQGTNEPVRLPREYHEWVLVGTATGLSYGAPAPVSEEHGAPGAFTQVYMEPSAYRHYMETGAFREGTTFALDIRRPTTGVSIARNGWFAGELLGVHAAVKDTARFDGGWGYFDVEQDGTARPVQTTRCASCHRESGALDSVFVQFYPILDRSHAARR